MVHSFCGGGGVQACMVVVGRAAQDTGTVKYTPATSLPPPLSTPPTAAFVPSGGGKSVEVGTRLPEGKIKQYLRIEEEQLNPFVSDMGD